MKTTDVARRLAICTSILLGVAAAIFLATIADFDVVDFQTYYHAGANIYSGSAFIGDSAPMPTGSYVYLPITAILFAPFSLLPKWTGAYPLLILLNVAGGLVLSRTIVLILKDNGVNIPAADRLLIAGVMVLSPIAVLNISQTQPNIWFAALLLVGYRDIQHGNKRRAGILFAIPAIFKLWPAFFGLWLLYHREWKAIGSAVVTGLSTVVTSILVLGVNTHVIFANKILHGRSWQGMFAGGLDPNFALVTIRRPISTLAPALDPAVMAALGYTITGLLLAGIYIAAKPHPKPFVTFTATVIAVLLAFPSTNAYLIFAFAPLIILLYHPRYSTLPITVAVVAISMTFTPGDIVSILGLLPLPPSVDSAISTITMDALSIASIPLISLLIVLGVLANLAQTSSDSSSRTIATEGR